MTITWILYRTEIGLKHWNSYDYYLDIVKDWKADLNAGYFYDDYLDIV